MSTTQQCREGQHPPATATADGVMRSIVGAGGAAQSLFEWCSNCGAARFSPNGQWFFPQQGKSGLKCHPAYGDYWLPSREQYISSGYKAENYDKFMADEQAAPKPSKP
jgi:hypothetical protein